MINRMWIYDQIRRVLHPKGILFNCIPSMQNGLYIKFPQRGTKILLNTKTHIINDCPAFDAELGIIIATRLYYKLDHESIIKTARFLEQTDG